MCARVVSWVRLGQMSQRAPPARGGAFESLFACNCSSSCNHTRLLKLRFQVKAVLPKPSPLAACTVCVGVRCSGVSFLAEMLKKVVIAVQRTDGTWAHTSNEKLSCCQGRSCESRSYQGNI